MKGTVLKIVSFALSLLLIGWLLSLTDLTELISAVANMNPWYYLAALGTYLCMYLVRTLRLWFILGKQRYGRLLVFSSIQQVLNRTLPFRSGEVFFPILLKIYTGTGYYEGIPKLFITRLLDLLSVVIAFLLVCLFGGIPLHAKEEVIIIGVLLVLIFILFTLKVTFPACLKLAAKVFPPRLRTKVSTLAENSKQAFNISYLGYLNLTFLSLSDKMLNFVFSYFIMCGLGYQFGLDQLIAANSLSGITEILPVNSLGSFGTTELGWAGALIYFGVPQKAAIASGFGYNIIAFSFTILFGIIAYLFSILVLRIKLNNRSVTLSGQAGQKNN